MTSPHPIFSLWQSPYWIQICPPGQSSQPFQTLSSQYQTRSLHVSCPYEFCHSPPTPVPARPHPVNSFWQESTSTIVPTRWILPTIHEPAQYSHRQPMPCLCLRLYDLYPTPVPCSIYLLYDFYLYNPVFLLISSPCPFHWGIKCIILRQSTSNACRIKVQFSPF